MKVEKWGDDFAIRFPADVVEALGLHEGAEIEIRAVGERKLEIVPDDDKEAALLRLRSLRRPLPAGFRVCRDEVNERQTSEDQ